MRTREESYDLAVAGGGLAGMSAAIAAARGGLKVVLMENRPVLGGHASTERCVTPDGSTKFNPFGRETGIISEWQEQERHGNHTAGNHGEGLNRLENAVSDMVYLDFCQREPNLTVYLNTEVLDVETAGRRIVALRARQLLSEMNLVIRARWFVDATGDGTVAAAAGCEFRMGREARDEYDEPLAPVKADQAVMPSTLLFSAVDVGRPIPFTPPAWAARYEDESQLADLGRTHYSPAGGAWWIEIGWPLNTIYDEQAIHEELIRQVYGVWDHFKNHCAFTREAARNYCLHWIAPVVGKRESRRVMGLSLLTQKDIQTRAFRDDAIGYGGWYADIHTPGGLLAKGQTPHEGYDTTFWHFHGPAWREMYVIPYDIPMSCLIARDKDNLFLAGRDLSATHVALGSVRLQMTLSQTGQAVGNAAVLASQIGKTLPELCQGKFIEEIQQRQLRQGVFIRGRRNRDPNDLVLKASRVSADSEAVLGGVAPCEGTAEDLRSGGEIGQAFPIPAQGCILKRLTPALVAKDGPATIQLALRPLEDLWDYLPAAQPIAQTTITLQTGQSAPAWDLGNLKIPAGTRIVRLEARVTQGHAQWGAVGKDAVPACASYAHFAVQGDLWRPVLRRNLSLEIDPPLAVFPAENIRSGVTRPIDATHMWMSDRRLPATLTIEWASPVEMDTVELTFDTNLDRSYRATPAFFSAPECVRDYVLSAQTDGGLRELARVSGNYCRRRVHRFDPVTTRTLTLRVEATNGCPEARVFEVRAYCQGT